MTDPFFDALFENTVVSLVLGQRGGSFRFMDVFTQISPPLNGESVMELEFLATYLVEQSICDHPNWTPSEKRKMRDAFIEQWAHQCSQFMNGPGSGLGGVIALALNNAFRLGERRLREDYFRTRTRYEFFMQSSYRKTTLAKADNISAALFVFVQRHRFSQGQERPLPSEFSTEILERLGEEMYEFANSVRSNALMLSDKKVALEPSNSVRSDQRMSGTSLSPEVRTEEKSQTSADCARCGGPVMDNVCWSCGARS